MNHMSEKIHNLHSTISSIKVYLDLVWLFPLNYTNIVVLVYLFGSTLKGGKLDSRSVELILTFLDVLEYIIDFASRIDSNWS
jgi:hypothetical protein